MTDLKVVQFSVVECSIPILVKYLLGTSVDCTTDQRREEELIRGLTLKTRCSAITHSGLSYSREKTRRDN